MCLLMDCMWEFYCTFTSFENTFISPISFLVWEALKSRTKKFDQSHSYSTRCKASLFILALKATSISKIHKQYSHGPWRAPTHSHCAALNCKTVFSLLLSNWNLSYLLQREPWKTRARCGDVSVCQGLKSTRLWCESGARSVGYLNTAHGSNSWHSMKVCNQCSNQCSWPWMTLRSLLQTHTSKSFPLLENERKTAVRHWLLRVC